LPELAESKLVTSEINPYLMYTCADKISDKDTKLKTIPPIRDSSELELTLELLKKSYFDIISSNHLSVLGKYKDFAEGNFFKALNGIQCLGFTLPLMWTIYS
jgi:dihydroorotase-like cyclic amidohydrolase